MGGTMPYRRFRGRNGLAWRGEGDALYPAAKDVAGTHPNAVLIVGDLNRMEQDYLGHGPFGDQLADQLAERCGESREVVRAVLAALFELDA